jgi:programmed cell death protein 4
VAERALRAWGGPDAGTAAAAKASVAALLAEYLSTRDAAEAQRSLRELDMPFFGHECVKRACGLAIESGGGAPDALLSLLRALRDSGAISVTQMAHGFARAAEAVEDLSLDVPGAKERWAALAADAAARGLLRAGVGAAA